jgi:AcrR family transcriptional regulator
VWRVTRQIESGQREAIVEAVLELVDTAGYDGVQLRAVAKRAHVSLATIYKLFATREELIFAALEQWRRANVYEGLGAAAPHESPSDGLMRVFRHIFEPWERAPRMLEAFHRVQAGPRGARLTEDGTVVVRPLMRALLEGEDPAYVDDVLLILEHVVYGATSQFVDGKLDVAEILPVIERAVSRLTDGVPHSSGGSRPGRATSRG